MQDILRDHPSRAFTRYLPRGTPPWRVTAAIQGLRPIRRDRGEDIIFNPPADLPQFDRQPLWGISLVVAGAVDVQRTGVSGLQRISAGGWFRFDRQPASTVRLHPVPGFREIAISISAAFGDHLRALGCWPTSQSWFAGPAGDMVGMAGMDLLQAISDHAVSELGLVHRLIRVLELAESTASSSGDGFARRACALLAAHPEPGFTLADAARAMGMDVQSFRKRFASTVGEPPGRWHHRHRMHAAVQLLVDHSVGDVSRRLGYSDPAVFSRQFRAFTGHPPSSRRSG